MLAHQARETAPILAREPMAELPEDGAVNAGKEGCSVVGVLVEVRPSRELPVQAFHKVHSVYAVIARQFRDQLVGEAPVLCPWNRRDRSHATAWSPLANDAMTKEDEAVVHMRDMGLLHIQRELQLIFQERSAGFAYRLSMRLGSLDHRDEIIRVATVGYCRFPLAVLAHSNRSLFENSEVPRPSVFPHLLAQVIRFHPFIEFMQHDVG